MKKVIGIATLIMAMNANATVSVLGSIEPTNDCKLNHKCEIHGMHYINIINNTDSPQHYKYVYMLQVKTSPESTDYKMGEVTVEPHKAWTNSCRTGINPFFMYYGLWDIRVETQVVGYENAISDINFKVNVNK